MVATIWWEIFVWCKFSYNIISNESSVCEKKKLGMFKIFVTLKQCEPWPA